MVGMGNELAGTLRRLWVQTYGPQRSVANRGYPSSRKGLALWAIIAGCIALVAALVTAILCLALGLGFSSNGVSAHSSSACGPLKCLCKATHVAGQHLKLQIVPTHGHLSRVFGADMGEQ